MISPKREASMRRERADAYLKIYEKFRDNGAGHRGDADMHEYRAMGFLTNARNQKILTVVFSMNGAPFALYAGLLREGMRAIIDVIRNDRQHEQETISVDKVTSCWLTNDASVIRATSSKHRSVLGLVNP